MANKELFKNIINQIESYPIDDGEGLDSAIFICATVDKSQEGRSRIDIEVAVKGNHMVMRDAIVAAAQNENFRATLMDAVREIVFNHSKSNSEVERQETTIFPEPI